MNLSPTSIGVRAVASDEHGLGVQSALRPQAENQRFIQFPPSSGAF